MINSLIEGGSNLSKDEIERMRKEAEANADADKKERARIDKMNQADGMIFQTEKQIKEFEDKLSDTDKTELNTHLTDLREAHMSGDPDKIDAAMAKMTEVWNKISTEMYKNSSTDATSAPADNSGSDTEYEEIK